MLFGRKKEHEPPKLDELDPQAIALKATLEDLRRVAADLERTNQAFKETVSTLKEETR